MLHVFYLQHFYLFIIYCFVTTSVFLTRCTYLKFVKNIIEQLNLLLSKSSVYTSLLCSSFCWTLCVTCFLFTTFLFIYCFVTPSVFLTLIGCTYLKFVKNIIEQLNLLLSKSSVYTSLLCSSFCWTLCVTCFLFLTFLFIYCFVTPSVFLTLIGCTYLKFVK